MWFALLLPVGKTKTYMKTFINYLLSRGTHTGNLYSFIALSFRFFCGLMMVPYGYGKIVGYEKYAADFFGDPIGIGNIPSLWLTIFAQIGCPVLLLIGFQTRVAASILAFNMLVAFKFHFFDPFSVKALPVLFLGMYVIQILLGAGKYSLDYVLYEKDKAGFTGNEVKGMVLFCIAVVVAWFVLGNCFSGVMSVCLIAAITLLYLVSLYYIRKQ